MVCVEDIGRGSSMQQRHARRCRPKCPSSMIAMVEADMSDTFLGNQARAGYGRDSKRLGSAVVLHCNEWGPLPSGFPLLVSEQDGSHIGEVVLGWALAEQA